MIINLNTLNKPIIIKQEFIIPKEYYQNTGIQELKNVYVEGQVFYNLSEEIEIDLHVKGEMFLIDAVTLEKISYPFTCEINEIYTENAENFQNTLDIIELLWENIVLEIPISLTKSPNLKLSGDGWTLNGEEEKEDSPFKDLNNLFKGGE